MFRRNSLRVLQFEDFWVLEEAHGKPAGHESGNDRPINDEEATFGSALNSLGASGYGRVRASADGPAPRRLAIPCERWAPYEMDAASGAQLGDPLSWDTALGLLGALQLPSGPYFVTVRETRSAGVLFNQDILAIDKVQFFKAHTGETTKSDKSTAAAVGSLLETGHFYVSSELDLTNSLQRASVQKEVESAFWWTKFLTDAFPVSLQSWFLKAIYGFVYTMRLSLRAKGCENLVLTLISRRSRRRSGTRYMARGVDNRSDVANFVETEQILWDSKLPKVSSFRIIRGSIPTFWKQSDGSLKPPPEIAAPLVYSRPVFQGHFEKLCRSYGSVLAVSLVSCVGSEATLYDTFERHFELDEVPGTSLLAFDFHAHCGTREYERGTAALISRARQFIQKAGVFGAEQEGRNQEVHRMQSGVIRVNCVDCLDRTNVAQSLFGRVALDIQLETFATDMQPPFSVIGKEATDGFRDLWKKNGDAVSIQYAGTKAMKADMTKGGKRSTTGMLSDGVKSVVRMYYKSVLDEGRQDVIDVVTGYAVNGTNYDDEDPRNPLWATFQDAQLVSYGGDRQESRIEIRERSIYLKNAEGLCFTFPRGAMFAYEKDNHRPERPRLRLHFRPGAQDVSAAAIPLHLQFRKNPGARERFLRMMLLWSDPPEIRLFGRPIRIRMLSYDGGEEPFKLGKLMPSEKQRYSAQVLCIVRPRASTRAREAGLACVPADFEEFDLILVDVAACSRSGPCIAVLASRDIAAAVMNVEAQATKMPLGHNNAAAISMNVAGTSVCLVGAYLQKPSDFPSTIGAISMGRVGFDISSQYEHFYAGGALASGGGPRASGDHLGWKELGQGFWSRILPDGSFSLRLCFPGLPRDDLLDAKLEYTESPTPAVLLVDEVIQGCPAPFIPNTAYSCSVLLEDLRADGLRNLQGSEYKGPVEWYLTLQCDLATEFVATKPATVGSLSAPSWVDPQLFQLVPSDYNEVRDTYIYGQLMLRAGYGDDFAAGSFVVPLRTDGEFTVAIRLYSKVVGKLYGEVSLTFEEVDPLSAGIPMNFPGKIKAKRTVARKMKNFLGKAKAGGPSRIADPGRTESSKKSKPPAYP